MPAIQGPLISIFASVQFCPATYYTQLVSTKEAGLPTLYLFSHFLFSVVERRRYLLFRYIARVIARHYYTSLLNLIVPRFDQETCVHYRRHQQTPSTCVLLNFNTTNDHLRSEQELVATITSIRTSPVPLHFSYNHRSQWYSANPWIRELCPGQRVLLPSMRSPALRMRPRDRIHHHRTRASSR